MPQLLKSLELQGYKTFASQSLIEFAGNITAIVGPNGSGKSNVADSVRWVLGEQSYSLMRAKKTEDMIFSGSERRARAGMASATIVFNNETNWLPIEYSEVSITRRSYRDGQNDYLLNGQKVRLKDISELLGKSGLAERTYTVIGQGLVDAALSLQPEERRRFFEEAAGIQLYRSRRHEAINRLDATRRNMDRALDILSEIKPRLRSLERQARRVEEYDQISADLQVLLREWYGFHWHNTQKEIQYAVEAYQTRSEILTQTRSKQLAVEKRIADERLLLQQVRERLNGWHTELSGLHGERERILRRLAVMDERQRSLANQRGDFDSNLNRMLEEKKALDERLASYQSERDRLKTEVVEAGSKAEELKQLMKERLAQRAVIDNKIRSLRQETTREETKQVRSKAGVTEINNRLKSLDDSKKRADVNLQQEQKKYQDGETVLAVVKSEVEEAEAVVKQLTYELDSQRERVVEFGKTLQALQSEKTEETLELTRAQAQKKVLEDAESSFSGMSQGPLTLLQSAKSGNLRGKYRALNTVMDVPAAYEIAVAAYLGEILDGVLLEEGADVFEALSLLSQRNKGRTILIPSESSGSHSTTDNVPAEVIGRLSDLISSEDAGVHFSKLFDQVYLVNSREDVRRAQTNLPKEADIVTLEGEIFRHNGMVIAGKDQGKSGILSRPRQKRELVERIAATQAKLDRLTKEITVAEKKYQAMQATSKQLENDLAVERKRLDSAEKSHRQVQLEVRQAKERLAFHQEQQEGYIRQIEKANNELEKINQIIGSSDEVLDTYRKEVRELQRSLNDLPIGDLQRDENHWRTNMAVANRALQDAEQRVKDFEASCSNTETQINQLQKRMVGQAEQLTALDAERTQLLQEEDVVKEKIAELSEKINPAEEELQQLEKSYSRSQDDLSVAQQASSVAERNATQTQLNMNRQRESLTSLREKIEEDFGLVAFQFEGQVEGQETLPFEGMVKQLPAITELPANLNDEIRRNRALIKRLGAINPDAKKEFDEVFERHEFLTQQLEDLKAADADLQVVIDELNELMRLEFKKTFDAVAAEFKVLFTRLFGGGSARLSLTDEENPTETGIDIHAKLPGRREQSLALLSGGERSLTAVALVFSLLKVSPTPFCILDEVDAMLDESNVGRFCDLLKELGDSGTQFIVITHNRGTVQSADVIFGVTKGIDSSSQLISLKLDEVGEDMVR